MTDLRSMDLDQQQTASRVLSGSLASTSGTPFSKRNEKVWVAVRIRPLLELEQLAHEKVAWKPVNTTTLQYVDTERPQQVTTYQYNRVFPETSTSSEVYAVAGSSLVAATMRGYNSTIFAYGQTGSGKTYTMQAVMQEAAADVFECISNTAGREYVIRLSAVEIYNEVVRDLLRDNSPALRVQDDPSKGVVAEGLTEAGVQSLDHLRQLLREVEGRRQTRATRMNDSSSRSHEIVRLYVESRPLSGADSDCSSDSSMADDLPGASDGDGTRPGSKAAPVWAAAINFVDLAGSERGTQAAGPGGDAKERLRLQEAGNINKSLLTLGSVIRTLGDNGVKRHVPYRDSKLTRLLQSSLSGNSHMTIITTISPAAGSTDNTKMALNFASAAKRVTMRPQLNQVPDTNTIIRSMKADIDVLKQQLATAGQELPTGRNGREEQGREAAAADRDQLRQKLHHLQNQILRSNANVAQWEGTMSVDHPAWSQRAKIAKQLRASSAGPLAAGRYGSDGSRDIQRPSTSYATTATAATPSTLGQQQHQQQPPARSPMRSSMRLLQCYLSIDDRPSTAAPALGGGRDGSQHRQHSTAGAAQQQERQASTPQHRQQQHWSRVDGQDSRSTPRQSAAAQQQMQQEQPAALPLDEGLRQQIQRLQEPSGPEAEAALAGLEVEARCYKHVQEYTLAELSSALAHLEAKAAAGQGLGSWTTEQLAALRSEVDRKQAAAALTQLGDAALQALERKMNSYRSDEGGAFEELRQQLREASSSSRLDLEAEPTRCSSREQLGSSNWPSRPLPGDATPEPIKQPLDQLDGGPSSSSQASSNTLCAPPPRGSCTGTAAAAVAAAAAAALAGGEAGGQPDTRQQLLRLQEAFRSSVEKDVSCLREVLVQYKEHIERLEIQKKVLLNQVLKLEFALEEEETSKQQLQHNLKQVTAERDAARSAAATAATAAAAAAAGGSGPMLGLQPLPEGGHLPPLTIPARNLSIFDQQEDGWASTPTQGTLLPRIVALWEELYVPLVYRSRFYLAFRGREVFYYEVEHRRLEWKKAAMLRAMGDMGMDLSGSMPGTPQTGMSGARLSTSQAWGAGARHRSKQLDRAARALDWERKNLASQLKWSLTEAEREELFAAWGVDPDTKERKLQLVFKLWAHDTLMQPDGMQRSSELVVMLCGMDASEHMMELVFGDYEREYALAAGGGGLGPRPSSSLGYAVSSMMRRVMPPRRGGGGSSPARSMNGLRAPSRAGSFTSRVHSGFMSLITSREQGAGGGGSVWGGGVGGPDVGGGSTGPMRAGGSFTSVSSLGWNAGASNLGR